MAIGSPVNRDATRLSISNPVISPVLTNGDVRVGGAGHGRMQTGPSALLDPHSITFALAALLVVVVVMKARLHVAAAAAIR